MDDKIVEMNSKVNLGGKSTQIGTQNNYYGMSYVDTKSLCKDLIKSELDSYKEEAEKIARERAERMENSFMKKLEDAQVPYKSLCEEFKNPDMQMAYITAQKSYIRLGSEELEETLSSLLVERVRENDRTLLQIALGEALQVVPLLLPEYLDILALLFIVCYVHDYKIRSIDLLCEYIRERMLPLLNKIYGNVLMFQQLEYSKSVSTFQHLAYSKVVENSGSINSFMYYLQREYEGLFMKGFEINEVEVYYQKYPNIFTKWIYGNDKLQFNAMTSRELEEMLVDIKCSTDEKNNMINLFKLNKMSEGEAENIIIKQCPDSVALINLWKDTMFSKIALTSVGIVLGAERYKQLFGEKIDMNIWF